MKEGSEETTLSTVSKQNTPNTIRVIYFEENGHLCSSLDIDDLKTCIRRGYPYKVVTYNKN